MRSISTYVAVAFAIFAFAALARTTVAQPKGENCTTKEDQAMTSKQQSPFACDRLTLNLEARKRHFEELCPALRSTRKAVRELPDGYEFQFPSEPKTIAMVAEWVAAGSALCLLLSGELEGITGAFFLKIRKFRRIAPGAAEDREAGNRLWELSHRLANFALKRP